MDLLRYWQRQTKRDTMGGLEKEADHPQRPFRAVCRHHQPLRRFEENAISLIHHTRPESGNQATSLDITLWKLPSNIQRPKNI